MTSQLAAGVRRLNAMIRHSRDPLFVIDPQGRLIYVNAAWEALTGLNEEAVLGRLWLGGVDDPAWNLDGSLTSSLAPPPEVLAGQPGGGVTLIPCKNGLPQRRRVEFWPYFDDRDQLLGWVALLRPENSPSNAPDSDSLASRMELAEIRESLRTRLGVDHLVGKGVRHDRLVEQVRTASASTTSVLIVGETGTGRHLVARTIHALGATRNAPLVPLDVTAIPPETIEKTLKNLLADTSAELAPTLLIREGLDLPRDVQRWLVETQQERRVRVLATTRLDPRLAHQQGKVREDFYFAMTAFVIPLAPLRERLDELPLLAQAALELTNHRGSKMRMGLDPRALEVLGGYDWPGNIHELQRVITAAHGHGEEGLIQVDDLPPAIRGSLSGAYTPPVVPPSITPLDQWLTQLERKLIEQALVRARQNKSRAAELLGISRPRLYRRIKELNIPDEPEPLDAGVE